MYTLFIDTHYLDVKIYLFKDKELIASKEELEVRNTSVITMPLIDSILKDNNITTKSLKKVAVCIGPGSFTGTRIGVTIAKTLAYSLNIDIVSMTSLDLIALNAKNNVYVSVKENNGYFIGLYNNKIDDIKYLNSIEYEEFKNNNEVVDDETINPEKLINYIDSLEKENVYDVNPIYIKTIEAQK